MSASWLSVGCPPFPRPGPRLTKLWISSTAKGARPFGAQGSVADGVHEAAFDAPGLAVHGFANEAALLEHAAHGEIVVARVAAHALLRGRALERVAGDPAER